LSKIGEHSDHAYLKVFYFLGPIGISIESKKNLISLKFYASNMSCSRRSEINLPILSFFNEF